MYMMMISVTRNLIACLPLNPAMERLGIPVLPGAPTYGLPHPVANLFIEHSARVLPRTSVIVGSP